MNPQEIALAPGGIGPLLRRDAGKDLPGRRDAVKCIRPTSPGVSLLARAAPGGRSSHARFFTRVTVYAALVNRPRRQSR